MMYKLQANKISLGSMTSTGDSLSDIFNDKIIAMFDGTEEIPFIFMTTSLGKVKKMSSELVFGISKKVGTPVMKLDVGDIIIDCRLAEDKDSITVNDGKKDYTIHVKDFTERGRKAGGVKGCRAKNKCVIKNV